MNNIVATQISMQGDPFDRAVGTLCALRAELEKRGVHWPARLSYVYPSASILTFRPEITKIGTDELRHAVYVLDAYISFLLNIEPKLEKL